MVASDQDCVYVNLDATEDNDKEVDIDAVWNISVIKQVTFDEEDQMFYILSNKFGPPNAQKLGFYVLQIHMKNPKTNGHFMIKWKNKLDIGDCNIQVLRAADYEQEAAKTIKDSNKKGSLSSSAADIVAKRKNPQGDKKSSSGMKEIIISFKQIFINTYNVICMDISEQSGGT